MFRVHADSCLGYTQQSYKMTLKFIALMAVIAALTGCALQPIAPKDVSVDAATEAKAREKVAEMVNFGVASYYEAQHVATLKGWKCTVAPYEPFILMSDGAPDTKALPDTMRAAFAKAGLDQYARVMWVDPDVTPNLKVGDKVKSIDGRSINTGDFYSMQVATRKARLDADASKPLKVVLVSGKTVEVLRPKKGCDADVASYYFYPPESTRFNTTSLVWLPSNMLQEAKPSDYRWMAAMGYYITSSPEEDSRRTKIHVAMVPTMAAGLVAEFIPFGDFLAGRALNSIILNLGIGGIYWNAAEFAERDAYARGEDPSAVPEFFARAKEQKIGFGKDVFDFTDQEIVKMSTLAKQLKAGDAPAPSYDKPADSSATQKTAANREAPASGEK